MTMELTPVEAKVVELLRTLPETAAQEVVEFAAFKATRRPHWSYDDPESLARAMERMASDPELLREMQAIERDFAPALNDGLEKY